MSFIAIFKEPVYSKTLEKMRGMEPIELTDQCYLLQGNSLIFYSLESMNNKMVVIDLQCPTAIWGLEDDQETSKKAIQVIQTAFVEYLQKIQGFQKD